MDRNKRIVDFNIIKKEGGFEVDPIYGTSYDNSNIDIGDQIGILGYVLVRTCYACPEQYDVYDADDTEFKNIRAYMRLRHGSFRVECPDVNGTMVYRSEPHGDGIFMDFERETELTNAIEAVKAFYDVQKITHVAIMINGIVYSLPKPNRHHHVIRALADLGLKTPIRGLQGFLDNNKKFLTRREAFEVAIASKQIEKPEHGLEELFSEDLW
jgi:hypothetical protein